MWHSGTMNFQNGCLHFFSPSPYHYMKIKTLNKNWKVKEDIIMNTTEYDFSKDPITDIRSVVLISPTHNESVLHRNSISSWQFHSCENETLNKNLPHACIQEKTFYHISAVLFIWIYVCTFNYLHCWNRGWIMFSYFSSYSTNTCKCEM